MQYVAKKTRLENCSLGQKACLCLYGPPVFFIDTPTSLHPNLSRFKKQNIAESSKSPVQPDCYCE